MKLKKMSLENVRKKQMDVSENLSYTQRKYKQIQDSKIKIDHLRETVMDTSLDEEYRKACSREVAKVQHEHYEQKEDLKYDLINLNHDVEETSEEINSNIDNIAGAGQDIEKVNSGNDNRGIIEKLKTKLKETTNGSLKEWEYHKKRFDSYAEDIKKMKEDLSKRDF